MSVSYLPTIGIECHVQLKTKTKLFVAVGNDATSAEPNSLISHVCMGMPGALPVLNQQAVHLAIRASYALNTPPQKFSSFDRKHYFYPDLPKGYQISQFNHPIIMGGHVNIVADGARKRIGITRAHLEEDAGKNTHPQGKNYSLVDLNRAGTPLLEIVSEPDIQSPAEAKAYARELYLLMKYAGVSVADLFQGNMRFDVNVSVSSDPKKLGIRTETKNLNSFRAVEKAVEYEIKRQIDLLEAGKPVPQETRGWDDAKQKTFSQRSKEESHDYRYMPDPDIPPTVLDDEQLTHRPDDFPLMPDEWRKILRDLGLDPHHIESLIDSEVEFEELSFLPLIQDNLQNQELAKHIANWTVNITVPLLREQQLKLENSAHIKLEKSVYELLKENKLSSTNAKKLLTDLLMADKLPTSIEEYAKTQGLIQVSNVDEIAVIVDEVIRQNTVAVEDVRRGEAKAIGFLVGQVMKQSKGKANPSIVQQLIRKRLS